MKNKDFKVNDNIIVQGYKGKIIEIINCLQYEISYNGKPVHNGLTVMTNEAAQKTIANGYTLIPTGKTATYFKVKFNDNENIKNTVYDNGTYGCLDDYEMYGTY